MSERKRYENNAINRLEFVLSFAMVLWRLNKSEQNLPTLAFQQFTKKVFAIGLIL